MFKDFFLSSWVLLEGASDIRPEGALVSFVGSSFLQDCLLVVGDASKSETFFNKESSSFGLLVEASNIKFEEALISCGRSSALKEC